MSGIIYNTMPVDYPVTQTEALLFLKQNSGTPDDSLVDDLIAMATQEVELITEHQLQEATSIQYFDGFCRGGLLKLKRPPVSSINSVKYLDVNGVEQTISSSNYRLINKNEASAFVQFNSTYILPIVDRNLLDTVYVEFVSGYETWNDSKPGVPVPIKKAILIYINEIYEHRLYQQERAITGQLMENTLAMQLLKGYMIQTPSAIGFGGSIPITVS